MSNEGTRALRALITKARRPGCARATLTPLIDRVVKMTGAEVRGCDIEQVMEDLADCCEAMDGHALQPVDLGRAVAGRPQVLQLAWSRRDALIAELERAAKSLDRADRIDQRRGQCVRSDEASRRSGLSADALRKRAEREGWSIVKSGKMNCYRLADLERVWPHKTFQADNGGK